MCTTQCKNKENERGVHLIKCIVSSQGFHSKSPVSVAFTEIVDVQERTCEGQKYRPSNCLKIGVQDHCLQSVTKCQTQSHFKTK